eukprot:605122_1
MSYTDDESNNDNINEYNESESDSDFGEDDTKVKLLSKKQKQLNSFRKLVREAKQHFNNSEFLNFQHDLKEINNEMIKNKWHSSQQRMPKFFVKHMLEIHDTLLTTDPAHEKNQKEKRALKSLQKNLRKDLKHFDQIELFEKRPDFWKDEDSDLGTEEHEDNMEESEEDDNPLYSLQDTAQDTQETKEEKDENDDEEEEEDDDVEEEEDAASDEDDEDDDDDDDDEDESTGESSWSSWSRGDENEEDKENDEDDDDDESHDEEDDDAGDRKEDGEGDKEKAFGIEAFDEETLAKMRKRSFWIKKSKRKKKKLSEKAGKRLQKQQKLTEKDKRASADGDKEASDHKKRHKPKKRGPSKWGMKRIRETFQVVLTERGKSSVNRDQIVSRLDELIVQCELHSAEQARLTVISVLISFYFDTASRKTTGMSASRWRKTCVLLSTMLKSLSKNIDGIRMSNDADIRLSLGEGTGDDAAQDGADLNIDWMNALQSIKEEDDDEEARKPKEKKEKKKKKEVAMVTPGVSVMASKLDANYQWVHGNILSFLRKLTDQLWTNLKALSGKAAAGEQYERRKKNVHLLVAAYKKGVFYFGKLGDSNTESEIEVLAMSAIHADYNPKMDELNEIKKRKNKKTKKKNKKTKLKLKFEGQEILNLPRCLVVRKAIFVFENGSRRCQTSAMLYLICFMGLHNRYELCRDLLLMSHLGSSSRIGASNVELQILYNRALAQYAVCSFCCGYWYSAMIILQELYASQRIKILLAQGYTKAHLETASAEQIKLEQLQQQRMLPPHFHVAHDLLETAHLLSSLFIEIPNMINNSYNKSFIRNPYFRKVWHQYLRRDLRVPPENTKDLILSCGIAMQNGEWSTCRDIINSLKLWKDCKHTRYVKRKVFSSAKRECLRCYLYRYGSVYHNISLARLAQMFELSEAHTKQFISKLIITAASQDQQPFASLDELTQCVVMHQTPPMPIQRTALEYSDKLSYFIEQNEKLLGIYSRYSSYSGRGVSSYKNKGKGGKFGKGKWDKRNDGKGGKGGRGDGKDKMKRQNKSRFTRDSMGGHSKNTSSRQTNQSNVQFGRRQNTRTQLRSMRPR